MATHLTSDLPRTAKASITRVPKSGPSRAARLEWIATHVVGISLGLAFLLPFVFVALTAVMSSQQTLTRDLWPNTWSGTT